MSSIRRRLPGDSSEPFHDPSLTQGEPVTLVPDSQLKKLKTKTRSKRRTTTVFGLGGVFGIVVAAFFAQQHDVINLEGLVDFNLESLLDVIPAGVLNEAKDITVRFSSYTDRLKSVLSFVADGNGGPSDMSAKRSTTTLSLSACIFNPKASKRCIRSSWFRVSFPQV